MWVLQITRKVSHFFLYNFITNNKQKCVVYVSKYFHCAYLYTLKQNLKIYDWLNKNTQLKPINTTKLGEKLLNLLHNLDIATSPEERIETSQLLLFILKIGLAPLGKGRGGIRDLWSKIDGIFTFFCPVLREFEHETIKPRLFGSDTSRYQELSFVKMSLLDG